MSLKDQLLKTGLANAKKARKAEHEKRQDAKSPEVKTAQQLAQQAIAEKAERDRGLNRTQQQEKERRAQLAQITQMIEAHRIERPAKHHSGEVAYQFTDNNKIKKLYVTTEQQRQLVLGQIAIARQGKAYELVPTIVAEKIQLRDAHAIALLNARRHDAASDGINNGLTAVDDPYADYKIPDDLMW
jgi:uncharacterized protein YaiL (DUF2058 family)